MTDNEVEECHSSKGKLQIAKHKNVTAGKENVRL